MVEELKSERSGRPAAAPVRIAALLTSFNRKALTMECLRAVVGAARNAGIELDVYLVDDGSTDGTAQAAREIAPEACVIDGGGTLYWNAGMRVAWNAALPADYDHYLWLNDDLVIEPDSLDRVLAFNRQKALEWPGPFIVVGRIEDPDSGETTYGGLVRSERSPLRIRYLRAGEEDCDTMNGNFVLVPRSVVELIGVNSPAYRHHFGDFDYGFRARQSGVRIFQVPFAVGTQKFNRKFAYATSYMNWSNWRFILFHPKGVPVKEQFHFFRRHAGRAWLARFVFAYLKLVCRGLTRRTAEPADAMLDRR